MSGRECGLRGRGLGDKKVGNGCGFVRGRLLVRGCGTVLRDISVIYSGISVIVVVK